VPAYSEASLTANWKLQGVFDTDSSHRLTLATYLEGICHSEHGRNLANMSSPPYTVATVLMLAN
jgi:hypothetical protein